MLNEIIQFLSHAVVAGQIMRDSGFQYVPIKEFNDYTKIMRDASRAKFERVHGSR